MKTYIFLIAWKEKRPEYEEYLNLEAFVKVVADCVDEAHSKLHTWAKGTKYHTARVRRYEELSKMIAV